MSKIQDYIDKITLPGEKLPTIIKKREAAEVLGVSEKTLERRANAGEIQQSGRAGQTFYNVEDLIRFEEKRNAEILKPSIEKETAPKTNLIRRPSEAIRQTQTDTNFNSLRLPKDLQERMINAQITKAEAEAKKAIYESNPTFALDEAAELFNLSIVDLKANAKTFHGRNKRLMITKKNLDEYLNKL